MKPQQERKHSLGTVSQGDFYSHVREGVTLLAVTAFRILWRNQYCDHMWASL